ncbi:putative lipoprotein [Desulfohalobium retbaense]|uniref:Lipoprotein n=1 Tax=Desulfohalobium retbaense (strain ATCC 49708 / DSM 5692 / JCM 16813 / HR100) TaxID=485915 RepID=C8X5T1_DESRD|nr:putative lipoprotein [Desulfohalobium retbaense]ACV69778.1 putative lipoprotein [Desulfohalobium retbaense DSM 5692]
MKRLLVMMVMVMALAGCASTPEGASPGEPGSGPFSFGQGEAEEQSNFYYDFEDVLVPKEMELVPDESLLFETPAVKIGVLVFKGRVDPVSLFDFFMANMPKDNWQLRSYFKYGRYIMVYEKPGKDCIISLTESSLSTKLQIWVTPRATAGAKSSGGMRNNEMILQN